MATFPNLQSLRKRAGMSQSRLSKKADVSRDVISSAEHGGHHSSDRLHALLNALNDEFYVGRGRELDPSCEISEDQQASTDSAPVEA